MADYSRYKTETLEKMRSAAWEKYYSETIKPSGNWGDGMRLSKLPEHKAWEKAKQRYDAICAELERRNAATENKCASCAHNIGTDVMDCEYACAGVTEVRDKGRIVVSCDDYKQREEAPVSKDRNKWESLFDQFLETIEFRLVKYPDGWGLIDKQGANLGDIESDRFCDAVSIIDRLDIYTQDSFVDDICETMDRSSSEDWTKLLHDARETMTPEELEHHRYDLEILDMICAHPQEINLKNCRFTEEKQEVDYHE